MTEPIDREAIHDELRRVRADLHTLVAAASPADLRRRTDGTRWTNQQMLFHLVFGYMIVRRLLPLVRLFGRLPAPCSRAFARVLNAGRRPFHAINYLGSCGGALVFHGPRLTHQLDRTLDTLHRRLDAETEGALRRHMRFPVDWDPFFRDSMSLADVYHYGTQHYDFHRRQLTLDQPESGAQSGTVTGTSRDIETSAARLFDGFLRRTHLCRPSDVADVVAEEAQRSLGASDVVLFLVNYEHTALVPVPGRLSPTRVEQPIDSTTAGRAFASGTMLVSPGEQPSHQRVWMPLLDGTDRMGVLELSFAVAPDLSPELTRVIERYAHAVAQTVLSKSLYGDVFELAKRSQPMTLGAQLLWSVVPPLTYATDGLVVAAMLEPAYSNGGDAFDYAVNEATAHFAVFDGMGHGLPAAGVSTFAVAAYRHSRRVGLDLTDTYHAMDRAVADQFADRFVTAVLAQLDLASGRLSWVSAGHPPPLLIRDGQVVKSLAVQPSTPLGVLAGSDRVAVGEEQLKSGDQVLLYTDGVTEARCPGGGFLTEDGLADFVHREAAAGQTPPETLRLLRRALLSHQGGELQDDATALLIDWQRGSEARLLPQSVT